MFGFGKKKKTDKKSGTAKKPEQVSLRDNGTSQSLAGDALRAQALANAKMARESIGEDTLDRIAAAMAKKQNSATEQAKRKIQEADAERVANEILSMIETRH
jgi:hypothetical protein